MKLGSNISVKNVLQVYVTKTMLFYVISSKKVRTPHATNRCSREYIFCDLQIETVYEKIGGVILKICHVICFIKQVKWS